jgi:myo-inositol catabolism protein IolS
VNWVKIELLDIHMNTEGRTGMQMDGFVLGIWGLGSRGWSLIEEAEAQAVLQAAWDEGVREFDSAELYLESEGRLAAFLKDKERSTYSVASKVLPKKGVGSVKVAFEKTLSLLNIECIDTYFIHWPKRGLDPRPLIEFLEEQRSAGRLQRVAVSNYRLADLELASEAGTIDVYQGGYHLFWRWADAEVHPWCREHGVEVQAYSPLGQGIFTGKFPREPQFEKFDNRGHSVLFEEAVWPEVFEGVEALKAVANAHGVSLMALALQGIRHLATIDKVVVGARQRTQVRANCAAFREIVPSGAFEEVDAISRDVIARIPQLRDFWRNDL